LAYSIYASTTPHADAGLFSVYLCHRQEGRRAAFDSPSMLATCAASLLPPRTNSAVRAKAQVFGWLLMSLCSPAAGPSLRLPTASRTAAADLAELCRLPTRKHPTMSAPLLDALSVAPTLPVTSVPCDVTQEAERRGSRLTAEPGSDYC
jgi:hypothetical protein